MASFNIRTLFREDHRLVVPGGPSIRLDFPMRDDPFRQWIHNSDSARNYEPFMVPLNDIAIAQAHPDAGFDDLEIVPSAEFDGAVSEDNTGRRFPRTMIIAGKEA